MTQLRWLVRLELRREPKFGETRQEVTVWAVRPYIALGGDKRRVGARVGVYARWDLRAAHNRARTECKTYYDTVPKGTRS